MEPVVLTPEEEAEENILMDMLADIFLDSYLGKLKALRATVQNGLKVE